MTMPEKSTLIITDDEALQLKHKLSIARGLFLLCYVSLLLLFTLLNGLTGEGNIKLWLVQCLPLLIFIPGLLQQGHRTYTWICFVILLYFIRSVVNTMSPFIRWHDVLELVLSIVIFITAMMTSRWLQYWQYYQRQPRQSFH